MVGKLFCDFCEKEIIRGNNCANYKEEVFLQGVYRGDKLYIEINVNGPPDICKSCLVKALSKITA